MNETRRVLREWHSSAQLFQENDGVAVYPRTPLEFVEETEESGHEDVHVRIEPRADEIDHAQNTTDSFLRAMNR